MTVIIGGGIVGLSIGWYLARAGHAVTVFERGEAGRGATWASAGMLAAHVEAEPGEEPLLPLLLDSRARWAAFARELEAAAGAEVGYRTEGTMVVALDRDDIDLLRFQQDYMRRHQLPVEWLSGYDAREREPHLTRNVVGALYSPLDHQVDNRKVVTALRTAFLEAGGTLREHTEVSEILISSGRVEGVRAGDERVAADSVVLAAGAWSRQIAGLPDELRPPVRPVKGQMLAIRMPPEAPLLSHVLWTRYVYMVPRADGPLLVGASVEEMSFDTGLTAGAIMDLLRRAWEALPGVYDLPIDEMWAGLRPTSRDDAPILGPSGVEGLIMATGHHRNGILLAPVTADSISRYILTGELAEEVKPFGLARFAA